MFTEKELIWIIIAIMISTFIIAFPLSSSTIITLFLALIVSALVILTNVFAKKLSSTYYNIKIEHTIWGMQQFGFREMDKTKNQFPMGLILPFFLAFLSNGIIKIFPILQFDAENLYTRRILKQSGERNRRKTEINESDLAFTAAWGFAALLLLALIGYFINFKMLTIYSVLYGFWNLLPISQLDGSKLFFGSFIAWVLILIIYVASIIAIVF